MKLLPYSRRGVKFSLLCLLFVQLAHLAWPASDPSLTVSALRTNSSLILSWPGYLGATYQVEASAKVSGWTNIGPGLTGTGGVLAFTNSIVPKGAGLFRVKRTFPAAPGTAVFNPVTGVLTIVADAAHNVISVANNGTGTILVNGGALPVTGGVATTANTVLIQILGSPVADQITVGNGLAPAHIYGAEGNDILTGGSANDIIVGGPGNDTISGKQGNDLIYLDGGDTAVWNPGDGSDTIEGSGGSNTLAFNGANINENITLSANGSRLLLTRDVAAISMDVNGVQTVNLVVVGGTDNVVVNSLAGTSVTRVNVDLAANGGAGDGAIDTVTLNGTAGADTFNVAANGAAVEVSSGSTLVAVTNGEPANDRILIPGVGGDTVNINGTAGADSMQVIASPVSGVRATTAAFTVPVDVSGALSLVVNGLGGSDNITGGNGVAAFGIPITLDGGDGDDIITGTDAADTILGGAGNDTVTPGRGNDVVFLGADNDTVSWNPGDGSDIIEGQGGTNTLIFNGANINENITLSANGSRLLLTRDVAAITMDVNGIQNVNLAVVGGTDNIVVNSLAGTSVTRVNVDLNGSGGIGDGVADTVTLNGTSGADTFNVAANGAAVEVSSGSTVVAVTNGELANDRIVIPGVGGDTVNINGTAGADSMQVIASPVSGVRATTAAFTVPVDVSGSVSLVVNGLGGNDTITGGNGVAAFGIPITLDGGDGDDIITGTDAADTILGGAGNDTVSGGRGNDVILLGADNDTVSWNPGDGSDIIEGQGGTNTLVFNGANVSENIALSANGSRLLLTRDVAAITMDVNGIQMVNLAVLGGADNIVVNSLAGTSVTSVNVDLNGSGGIGDGAIDTVTLNGTAAADSFNITASGGAVTTTGITPQLQITHPEVANDKLVINGLGGTDAFSVGAGVTSLIGVTTNQ